MNAVVFCGPTIRPEDVRPLLDADVRPPVARGDVLAAVLDRPAAIGIIDGYFARVPSVWHKEILWAMSEGIHVFGAASMGALRAAELAPFGMEGVGVVFEQYNNGTLADDDEVAVIHASEEHGYRSLSDAMVNIRITVNAAENAGIISQATREALELMGKELAYADRSYPMLLAKSGELPESEITAFRDWLPTGRVDQKRDDAMLMLQRMSELQRAGWTRKSVTYHFAQTDAWEALRNDVSSRVRSVSRDSTSGVSESQIIDELLLCGRAMHAYDGALARALCLEHAQRYGIQVDARAVEAVIEEFRREQSLLQPAEFDKWLEAQGLDEDQIVPFFRREALMRRMTVGFGSEMQANLVDHLRSSGQYGPLSMRAEAKNKVLSDLGMDSVVSPGSKLTDVEIWDWYFVKHLGTVVPNDLESYAHKQRTTVQQLRSAVIREYVYLTMQLS